MGLFKGVIMKFLKVLILLVLIPLLFASCEIHFDGDKVRIKGITLEHSRTITLTDNEKYDTFIVEAHSGNIALEGGQSYDLEVKIWEKYENDVTLSIQNGKLVGETASGKPFAIATIEGVIPINTSIDIQTGAGNIMISDMEGKEFEVETGAGNINVTNIKTNNIEINTGAGNILIKSLIAIELECNAGVGNIDVFNSTAKNADCNSGIGNISVSESQFERHDFNTGIGKVNYRNNGKSVEL